MCTNLVAIPNPSRRFRFGIDQMFNFVPCGHCSSCIQLNQNDWYVRLYHEWQNCRSKGGIVLFPTLTYNPSHLPWFFDYSYDIDNVKFVRGAKAKRSTLIENGDPRFMCPCFKLSDIQSCITKLREYINRDDDFKGLTFRYLVTSEFGEKRSRPHYHALFFLDHVVKDKLFTIRKFTRLLRKAWSVFYKIKVNGKTKYIQDSLGYISYSDKYGAVVNSINALKYVTKYITKDFQYFDNPAFKFGRYANISDYLQDDENKEMFSPYRPKHLQSINLGLTGIAKLFTDTKIDFDHLEDYSVSFKSLDSYFQIPGDDYGYNVPRYYKRKIFKKVVKDEQFPIYETCKDGSVRNTRYMEIPTDVCRSYAVYKFNDNLQRSADGYVKFFQHQYLSSFMGSESATKLIDKFKRLVGDNGLLDIALYENLYKGLAENDYFVISDFSAAAQRDFLRDNAEDFYFSKVYEDGVLHSEPVKNLQPEKFYNPVSLGLHCYAGLDQFLGIIHDLQKKYSGFKTEAYFEKLRKKRKTKEEYNLYHYE